VRNRPQSTR